MPVRRTFRRGRPRIKRRAMKRLIYSAAGRRTLGRLIKRPATYSFKRFSNFGSIQCKGNPDAPTFGVYTFALNDLPNFTEFTNLYDQYRINKVVLKFIPQFNVSDYNVGHNSNVTNPGTEKGRNTRIFIASDYDDNTPLTQVDAIRQYANCKIYPIMRQKPITHVIVPAVQTMVYETAVSTGYNPKFKQWINCADNDVPHYGIKWAMESTNALNSTETLITYFKVEAIFYVSFKGVI